MKLRAKMHTTRFPNLHDAPSYDNLAAKMAKSPVILIRHASSISNYMSEELFEHFGKENVTRGQWIDVQSSPDLNDCKLSEKGIQQCTEAASHAKNYNFVEVYISPLRRTMETAYHIFKDHPGAKSIKFVVEPHIREKIMIGSDAPSWNSHEVITLEYCQLFQDAGMTLDLSMIEKACAGTSKEEPKSYDPASLPWYFGLLD